MTATSSVHGLVGGSLAAGDMPAAAWCDHGCAVEAATASDAIALLSCLSRNHASQNKAAGLHKAIDALTDALPSMEHGIPYDSAQRMLALGVAASTEGLRLLIAVRTVLQLAHHEANGRLAPGSAVAQLPHAAAALARAINQEGPAPDAP